MIVFFQKKGGGRKEKVVVNYLQLFVKKFTVHLMSAPHKHGIPGLKEN